MGGKKKKVVVGYRYYLGMHMIICHGPVDAVTGLMTGDYLAWTGNVNANTQIGISQPNLYGGKSREGGISGKLDIEFGGAAQGANSYLASVLGDVPAFRGVVGLVSRRMYLGDSPYLKPWAIRGRRTQINWQNTLARIGEDMNPAHIIYNCLTDGEWGMGYPETDIDQTAFAAAAQTLYNEGFGLSTFWVRSISIQDFINEIKGVIDAAHYVEPSNGLITLKLLRGDYDPATLPVLSPSNIVKIESYTRHTHAEMANTVVLKFSERQDKSDEDNAVTVHNIALIQSMGQIVPHHVNYPAISTAAVASKVAARELRKVSQELSVINLIANSEARDMRPGSVFKLNWPKYGIASEIMRVVTVDFGTLQSGEIRISAVQDIFGTATSVYADVPQSGWTPPLSLPVASVNRRLEEMPYYTILQEMGESDAALAELVEQGGFLMALYTQPVGDALEYRLFVRPNTGEYVDTGRYDFTPTGILEGALSKTATSAMLDQIRGIDGVFLGSLAFIDDEIVQVTAVTDMSITIVRGVLDTVPAEHADGKRVWFHDDYFGADRVQKVRNEVVNVRSCTITGRGELALADAPTDNYTFAARMIKPYPPGRFRLNNVAYPEYISGELTIAWAHRDRLTQTGPIVSQDASNIGPESGTTYVIRIYGETGVLKRTYSGETGTSKVYLLADEITDSGLGRPNGVMRVVLFSQRAGYDSWQAQDHTFDCRGYGMLYGQSYGE
jgi:hypothetical protein